MTDFEDFSPTFRRIVASSTSLSGVERRLRRELTAGQVAVLTDFFEERQRQEQVRLEKIRRLQRAQQIQRARVAIMRDRLGRTHARDLRTGRFRRLLRRR